MPAPGATPIIIYHTTTASAQPSTANLNVGELAINVTDKKVYSKDGSNALITVVGTLGNQEASSVAITGGSINGTSIGASTRSTGAFTTLTSNAATTFTAGTASTSTTTGTAVITGGLGVSGRINAANFDGIIGANTAAAGTFTDLTDTGLTSGRITYASTGGNLVDSANLTFNGTILTSTGFSGPLNGTVGATTSAAGTFTSLSDSGNLTFTGTGNRITGDFSNATLANRVAFQTSATNSSTTVNFLPSGTSSTAQVLVSNSSDVTNASYGGFLALSSDVRIQSTIYGTGTFLPMTLHTGGTERMRIDTSGNVGIGTSSPTNRLDVYNNAAASVINVTGDGFGATFQSQRYDNTATASFINVNKYRGSSATPLAVNSGDGVMSIAARAYGGTNTRPIATINALVDTYTSDTNISGYLTFNTNSGSTGTTERIRITSAGDVGIGTSSPANKFEVFGNATRNVARASTTADTAWLEVQASDYYSLPSFMGTSLRQYGSTATGTTAGVSNTSLGLITFQNSAAGLIQTNGGAPIVLATSATERMRIDSDGNVGIGTSSPINRLDVRASGDTIASITAIGGTNGASLLRLFGSDNSTFSSFNAIASQNANGTQQWYMGGDGNVNTLVFKTSTSERMRIDASGRVLVGTTNASITAGVGVKIGLSTATEGDVSVVGAATNNANDTYHLYSTGAGAFRFYVEYGGQIRATVTSIAAISDVSLKENIRDLETGLVEVMALRPRRFDWIEETKLGTKDIAGFIAQEVEPILPDLVSESKYSLEETKKSVRMGDMVPTLVKAIQEQQAIITDLKARIEVLENKE
jgi:hypothetical protein